MPRYFFINVIISLIFDKFNIFNYLIELIYVDNISMIYLFLLLPFRQIYVGSSRKVVGREFDRWHGKIANKF